LGHLVTNHLGAFTVFAGFSGQYSNGALHYTEVPVMVPVIPFGLLGVPEAVHEVLFLLREGNRVRIPGWQSVGEFKLTTRFILLHCWFPCVEVACDSVEMERYTIAISKIFGFWTK
jgi:hypothetical protein